MIGIVTPTANKDKTKKAAKGTRKQEQQLLMAKTAKDRSAIEDILEQNGIKADENILGTYL